MKLSHHEKFRRWLESSPEACEVLATLPLSPFRACNIQQLCEDLGITMQQFVKVKTMTNKFGPSVYTVNKKTKAWLRISTAMHEIVDQVYALEIDA